MGWYGVLGVAGAYYGAVRLWSGRIVVIIVEERIFMCVEFDFKFSSFHVIALI
jgi:hypothetical protein